MGNQKALTKKVRALWYVLILTVVGVTSANAEEPTPTPTPAIPVDVTNFPGGFIVAIDSRQYLPILYLLISIASIQFGTFIWRASAPLRLRGK